MRRILFVLVLVIALAGVVAYMAPASGQANKGTRDDLAASLLGARSNARRCRFQVGRWCRWRRQFPRESSLDGTFIREKRSATSSQARSR